MKKYKPLLFIVTALMAISANIYAQKLQEDFSDNYIYDWYMINTSSPQPAAADNWKFRMQEPLAGAEYGNSNFYSVAYNISEGTPGKRYDYAAVGYSEYDYDGADISKWFITPVIHNIKNGDVFVFRTRSKPEQNDLVRTLHFLNSNTDRVIDCNRPNRMEVRLNTNFDDDIPFDSINVGRMPQENGHFDHLLLTINKDLTLDGYSQEWTLYTITISGLPENQVTQGRIGFKYYVTNAGYNNCKVPNTLPPPVQQTFETQMMFAKEIGKPFEYAALAFDVISIVANPSKGKNGTSIGIDDLEYKTNDVAIIQSRPNEKQQRFYWNKQNIATGKALKLGYQGSPGCSDRDYPHKDKMYFYIENGTTAPVEVNPKAIAINGSSQLPLELDFDSSKTVIPAGGGLSVTARLKGNIPVGKYYNAFRIESTTGENLGEVKFEIHIDPPRPPKAVCKELSASVKLADVPVPVAFDAKELDAGSVNSCHGDAHLKFEAFDEENNPITEIDCEFLGNNDVTLKVTDTLSGMSSFCDASIDVYTKYYPIIESDLVQNYYLPDYKAYMPVSAITKPSIVAGCGNFTPQVSRLTDSATDWSLGSLEKIGPGTYTVHWVIGGGNYTGFGTSKLRVIDTLAPKAFCKDTLLIGFTDELPDVGVFKKENISAYSDLYNHDGEKSYDNTKIGVNSGIVDFKVSSPWYGDTSFTNKIPFTCSDAGASFPVTLQVADLAGNTATCNSRVKIVEIDQPNCKDTVELLIDPATGVANIEAGQLMLNGSDDVCGVSGVWTTVSSLNCNAVGEVTPVEVTYYDDTYTEHSCVSMVKVSDISREEQECASQLVRYVPEYAMDASVRFDPLVTSVCGISPSWTIDVSGANNFSEVSNTTEYYDLAPGVSDVIKTSVYKQDTFTCEQRVIVLDTVSPFTNFIPEDVSMALPNLPYCTHEYEIESPFQQGSYTHWNYTLSGATSYTSIDLKDQVYVYDEKRDRLIGGHEKQPVDLLPGVTTITLRAWDKAGNMTELSYDYSLNVSSPPTPSVYANEFQDLPNSTIKGDFTDDVYPFKIESPVKGSCEQYDYMWYYEVRDSYAGNILYERDSIPMDSGAYIPLMVTPLLNQTNNNVVHFGFHDHIYGNKTFSTHQSVRLQDTLYEKIHCPADTAIFLTDLVDYKENYTLHSPIPNSHETNYWGFSVAGATNEKTSDQSIAYNSNQQNALSLIDASDRYPVLAYNADTTVNLNVGENLFTFRVLEGSGNLSVYNEECSFEVMVRDTTTPAVLCPADDTLIRTGGPCDVQIGGSCEQVSGFTKRYGINELGLQGNNSSVYVDYDSLPQSVSLVNTRSEFSRGDAYLAIIARCDGTISFDWEYQSSTPQYFRPFINHNDYAPMRYDQPAISGFDQNNTGVQSGTFSQTVKKDEYVVIGVTEGGNSDGYFKISNFSGPEFSPEQDIELPVIAETPYLTMYSSLQTHYPIGTHDVFYNIMNMNNGKIAECVQKITVIDSLASSLSCSNADLYLNQAGFALLKPEDVISTCFNVSNTTASKDTFRLSDLGTQTVTITSVTQAGDTLSCNIDVTVADTIKPLILTLALEADLDNSNTSSMADSTLRKVVYDNVGIDSVSLEKTSFDCNNIGVNKLWLTAIDSNGNTSSKLMNVSVYPSSFSLNTQEQLVELCVGQTASLQAPRSDSSNSYSRYWQTRQPVDSLSVFNKIRQMPGSIRYPKFYRQTVNQYHDDLYVVYKNDLKELQFRVYNHEGQTWMPTLSPITDSLGIKGEQFFMGFYDTDNSPYVVYLDINGKVKMFRFSGGNWQDEYVMYEGNNHSHFKLYHNNGYFFPVYYTGSVHAMKEYYTGVSNLSYMHVDSSGSDVLVANAKNILGIRTQDGQNHFYRLNINPASLDGGGAFLPIDFGGLDTLPVDPTSGSALFSMESYNDEAYIAYKTSSSKVSMKKYDTTSATWNAVGETDFSENEIHQLHLKVVDSALHIAYVETGDKLVVKRWNGASWENKGTGTIYTTSNIQLVDMLGDIAIESDGSGNHGYLFINDGWVYTGNTQWTMDVNTDSVYQADFRTLLEESNCATMVTKPTTVVVRDNPNLETTDAAMVGPGVATLEADYDIGGLVWYNADYKLLSRQDVFETPMLNTDQQYPVVAMNHNCSSDTAVSNVFVNTDSIAEMTLSYEDTVCSGEFANISVDNSQSQFDYLLYKKGTNGYSPVDGPNSGSFYTTIDSSGTYKVKAIDPISDAAAFGYGNDYISFGSPSLNITDELTIEAMIYIDNQDPAEALRQVFMGPEGGYDYTNFSWKSFWNVDYPSSNRSIYLPNLPYNGTTVWVHVATTIGPDSMEVYYNGELVASKSFPETTENIKQRPGTLAIAVSELTLDDKAYAMRGLDEYRIWNVKRTASEIKDNYDQCLTGSEPGLVLYNSFSSYVEDSAAFLSETGPDAKVINYSTTYPGARTLFRNGDCYPVNYNERFSEPFSITALHNQPQLLDFSNNYYSNTDSCGAELVELWVDVSNGGTAGWYDQQEGGNLIAVGDTLRHWFDRDTTVYARPSEYCYSKTFNVDLVETPKVYSATPESPLCIGDYLDDVNMDVQYGGDADDYAWYDAPAGGNQLDPETYEPTETDTLYIGSVITDWTMEGKVIVCESDTTMPVEIVVNDPELVSMPMDTAFCDSAILTLEAKPKSDTGTVQWVHHDKPGNYYFVGDDTLITTPNLTQSGYYRIRAEIDGCYGPYDTLFYTVDSSSVVYDTVLACEPYTWIDGITYSNSGDYEYRKANTNACDSVFYLHLLTNNPDSNILAEESSFCIGDSTRILAGNSDTNTLYTLVDVSDSSVVDMPQNGDGGNLYFSTGSLTDTTVYKMMIESSLSTGSYTETCINQLGNNITVNVGTKSSIKVVKRCNDYYWKGNTYTASGVYYDTTVSGDGCDSITELHLTVYQPTTGSESVTACGSYTWHDSTYTESTTATWTGATIYGCDSVVTLNLTILPVVFVDTAITVCDSLVWDGSTYTKSGSYTRTFSAVNGCDSVVTIDLTINKTRYSSIAETVCGSYDWFGNTYASSGTYTHRLVAANDCDSVIELNLLVLNTPDVGITHDEGTTTLTVNETGASSYQWVNCDNGYTPLAGDTLQSLLYTPGGEYAVIVDNGTCIDTSDCINTLITEIQINELSNEINAYPVPTRTVITIEFEKAVTANYAVKNILGIPVQSGLILKETKIKIDLNNNEEGVYFIEIMNERGETAIVRTVKIK